MHGNPRLFGFLLVAPALLAVGALFVYPLGFSVATAFTTKEGAATLANFARAFELYSVDIVFTLVIVGASTTRSVGRWVYTPRSER